MELIDALEQTFQHADGVIGNVRPDQYDDPTPCSEWAVRDLLSHTIGVVSGLGAAAAGNPPSEFALGTDPAAQFREAADGCARRVAHARRARQDRRRRSWPDARPRARRHQPARHRDTHVGHRHRHRTTRTAPGRRRRGSPRGRPCDHLTGDPSRPLRPRSVRADYRGTDRAARRLSRPATVTTRPRP